MTPLILPAGEYAAISRLWEWLKDSGHLDCGGWTQDLADPSGTVTCSCGSRFVPCAGVAAEAGQAVAR